MISFTCSLVHYLNKIWNKAPIYRKTKTVLNECKSLDTIKQESFFPARYWEKSTIVQNSKLILHLNLEHRMYEHNIGCMFDANSISGRRHVHRFNMYLMPAGWL